MKQTNEEEQSKALVKQNIWNKIRSWFKKLLPQESNKKDAIEEIDNIKEISKEPEVTAIKNKYNNEEQTNELINQAKKAYENYILISEHEFEKELYNYIEERIKDNEKNIKRVIEINKSKITFDEIMQVIEEEKKNLSEYKKTIRTIKIDDKFMFSEYQVPEGIIGVEVSDSKEAIENIFKSITTRNAIIVIEENNEKYSIENLILLIVKESLNKFNVDNNIIQIVGKEEITVEDEKEFDILIKKNNHEQRKEFKESLYIYLEDEYFKDIVQEEIKSLNLMGKNVELVTGEFYDCIRKINASRNLGVSIYSQDRKKGYKFINLINSKNVFFNSTLRNIDKTSQTENTYLISKNIMCEYKLF